MGWICERSCLYLLVRYGICESSLHYGLKFSREPSRKWGYSHRVHTLAKQRADDEAVELAQNFLAQNLKLARKV